MFPLKNLARKGLTWNEEQGQYQITGQIDVATNAAFLNSKLFT